MGMIPKVRGSICRCLSKIPIMGMIPVPAYSQSSPARIIPIMGMIPTIMGFCKVKFLL